MADLAIWDSVLKKWIVESGQYELIAGYSSTDFVCAPITFSIQ